MKQGKTFALLTASAVVLALSGCGSVKKELGVGRQSPDEFMVVKRAPLTLPPDYDLRPPSADSAPPAQLAANQAKTQMLGSAGGDVEKATADQALLGKMGATNANPDIRNTIDKENGYIALDNKKLVDKLVFWEEDDGSDAAAPTSVVNAEKEAARIKQNQADGKPLNQGDVPVIEKKKSTIDKIF